MIKRLFDLLIGRVSVWESEIEGEWHWDENGIYRDQITEYGLSQHLPDPDSSSKWPNDSHEIFDTRAQATWSYILHGADWYSGEDDRYLGRS